MSRFAGRTTRNFRQDHNGHCYPNSAGYCACPLTRMPESEAELVCSDVIGGDHLPVVDLDLPCTLVPSGTAGHFHLYLDKAMSFELYVEMLEAMARAGVVQWGFVNATQERGFGSVRHPDRPKRAAA